MKKMFAILMLCSWSVFAEPVDINKADADTISKSLTNIGPKKAAAIVQYRTEHGDFKSVKDIENVSGIGAKTIALIEKDIVFTDSAPAADKKSEKTESAKKTK